jgi:hypothetical protein
MAKKIAKVPVEWVDGKIVLRAPPANPLKGKGNQRLTKESLGWAITEGLFDWFYKHLEDRHKTSGRIIHNDGDALRDMLDEDPNFNNNYYAISPEANKLLKDKLEFWKEKVREGSKLKREQKKQEMKGGDFETPPEWVREKIVLLKPAESPNKKYYWKPNFDGENYKAVLWFRDHLPNTHQGQITDPNNGYPAKTMSTEAGELWFKHKGFWLAQYYIPIKEKEAKKKELVSAGQETLKNASAKAGIPLKELKQKLENLSTMAKGEDVSLAIRMVADFDDVWLFESLLAGSTIDKDGYLIPGKPLKMFKEHAEFFGVLALVNAPESTNLHASLNKTKLRYIHINEDNFQFFEEHICRVLPNLKSEGDFALDSLTSLSDATAKVLSKHKGDLSLNGLKILSDSPGHVALAKKLASQELELALDDLISLSDTAALALSKHKGGLSLNGLKILNDSIGHVALAKKLASHEDDLYLSGLQTLYRPHDCNTIPNNYEDGLYLSGLQSLSEGAAAALSKHKGNLSFRNLTTLGDGAAKALSEHEGNLYLEYLQNLTDSIGHVALAKKLASQKISLCLYGLTSLSDGAAEALSNCEGDLILSGLKSLSDTGAQALAKKKGGKNKMKLPSEIQKKVDKYRKK